MTDTVETVLVKMAKILENWQPIPSTSSSSNLDASISDASISDASISDASISHDISWDMEQKIPINDIDYWHLAFTINWHITNYEDQLCQQEWVKAILLHTEKVLQDLEDKHPLFKDEHENFDKTMCINLELGNPSNGVSYLCYQLSELTGLSVILSVTSE
jgi:hypothetical protein